jgi:16S rRNA (cytidine1402-2'-O)-methyltransferase
MHNKGEGNGRKEMKPNHTPRKKQSALTPGLYLVATPIGHAQDITLRALEVLEEVDAIYCEDTRTSQKLFHLHGIAHSRLKSAHDHNEERAGAAIAAEIQSGKSVAYVSDAGLPLISDPGHGLVQQVLDAGLPVTSIPGANAALTALQLSGLPPLPFYFAGFLPPKSKARLDALRELSPLNATLVFYEAPHRLAECLADMLDALGNRPASYARELTKLHEEVQRGPLQDLMHTLEKKGEVRGEIVICVGPPEKKAARPAMDDRIDALLLDALKTLSPRDAAFDIAARTGLARRDLYNRILALKDASPKNPKTKRP